jgi:quinol monooxygenase YgiN
MSVVFSIIRFYPAPKHRAQVIELLRSVQDLTRPSPGCVGCWLSEEDFLHNHIRYAEQWESEEALHEHIRSDLYRRVLAAMELSKQQPEVRFYYCSETKGLELIEAARRQEELHGARLGSPLS